MASAPAHSWEAPKHSWDRQFTWERGSDSESDHEVGPEEAGELFTDMLIDLKNKSKISARDVCILCHFATLAGIQGPAKKFAKAPGHQVGKYSGHVDNATRLDHMNDDDLYRVEVPATDRVYLGRTTEVIPIFLAHEVLAQEINETPSIVAQVEEQRDSGQLPPHYYDHPVVLRHPDRVVHPICLYLDGVPFTGKDGLMAVYVHHLLTNVRHLVAVIRQSAMCSCGCGGQCTLRVVFFVLRWTFVCASRGESPNTRHDNSPFHDYEWHRSQKGGSGIPVLALVHIKGDWVEFTKTLGFPPWNSKISPCLFCFAGVEEFYNSKGLSPISFPCELKTRAAIEQATRRCEIIVTIGSVADQNRVRGNLYYDKSKGGAKGRCLRNGIPHLGLREQDRLEPDEHMLDVAQFEKRQVPFVCKFWRRSEESLVRFRNALWCEEAGISFNLLSIDIMHVKHLGVFKDYVAEVFWVYLENPTSFGIVASTQPERLHLGVLRLRNELFEWYKLTKVDKCYRLSDLVVGMLGKSKKGAGDEGC